MGGSDTVSTSCAKVNSVLQCGFAGVYGELGVPTTDGIPGSRRLATSWKDPLGNLWLLGGFGYDSAGTESLLNDLWEFGPSTQQWTWVSGKQQRRRKRRTGRRVRHFR